MIIKYYNNIGDLHIIENVEEVAVPFKHVEDPQTYSDSGFRVYNLDDHVSSSIIPRIVTYVKDNTPCALRVTGIAFICTNEGKTIEKVSGGSV